MKNSDTVRLLKECDSGTKMAVASFEEVIPDTQSFEMKKLLQDSKQRHESLGNELHSYLNEIGCEGKEPNAVAKGMSWMKTNFKMAMHDGDETIADLMTEGCNMGIKSLSKFLNEYKDADDYSKTLCNKIISEEEALVKDLREYL